MPPSIRIRCDGAARGRDHLPQLQVRRLEVAPRDRRRRSSPAYATSSSSKTLRRVLERADAHRAGSLPVPSSCPPSAAGQLALELEDLREERLPRAHRHRPRPEPARRRVHPLAPDDPLVDERRAPTAGRRSRSAPPSPSASAAPVHHAPDSSPAFEIRDGTARRSSSNARRGELRAEVRARSATTAFDVTNGVFGWNGTGADDHALDDVGAVGRRSRSRRRTASRTRPPRRTRPRRARS